MEKAPLKRRSVFTRLRTRLDVLEDLILVVKSEISSGEFLTGDFLMEEFRTFRRIRSRPRPTVQLARFTGIINVGCPLPKSWRAYKLFARIVCCADRMRIGIHIIGGVGVGLWNVHFMYTAKSGTAMVPCGVHLILTASVRVVVTLFNVHVIYMHRLV